MQNTICLIYNIILSKIVLRILVVPILNSSIQAYTNKQTKLIL